MTPAGTPARWAFPDAITIQVALKVLRARYRKPDQRLMLLFLLLDRVGRHAKEFGVAALLIHEDAFDAFAYDAWAEGRSRERGGQHDAPVQGELRRIGAHWRRALADAADAPLPLQFTALPDGFTFTQLIAVPPGAADRVTFTVRWGEQWLSIAALVGEAIVEENVPHADSRIVVKHDSVYLLLHATSQALVAAVKRRGDDPFNHTVDRHVVSVHRQKPIAPQMTLWAALMAVVLLPASCAYRQAVARVRRELHTVVMGATASPDCIGGRPRVALGWTTSFPRTWATRVRLLRNGQPIARADDRAEYDDLTVTRGAQYAYSFDAVDMFGRVIKRDDTVVMATVRCANDPPMPRVSVTPQRGTWTTPFTFTVRIPAADGVPQTFAWNSKGLQYDAATDRFFAEWTTPTREATRTVRFTPCDHCPYGGKTAEGAAMLYCSVVVEVHFDDGSVRQYGSPPALVIDPAHSSCSKSSP